MYGLDLRFNYDNFVCMLPQVKLWEHILGIKDLSVKKKIRNTLRVDNKPGCWLDKAIFNPNVIVLIDFADKQFNSINVIKGYAIKHSLSYTQALAEIQNMYPDLCKVTNAYELVNKSQEYNYTSDSSYTKHIKLEPALWRVKDREYWTDKYNISIDSLKKDGVFPINRYYIDNSEVVPMSRAYWLPSTNNPSKGKIYQPLTKLLEYKWYSTMTEADYWYEERDSDTLIITSSYKDMKVLSTYTDYSVIAFLSENIFPSLSILSLIADYDRVIVWYDHDAAGINCRTVLIQYMIPNLPPDIVIEHITTGDEEYVDPSDYIAHYGEDALLDLIDIL